MKENLTELVFILDMSGSMYPLTEDTIGGFNSMIEKQKKEESEAIVSLVVFDTDSKVIFDRTPLDKVEPLTGEQYCPGGCTALLDAMGDSIRHIGNVHKYAREEDRPAKTVFVITTDGMENASRHYSADEVKQLVTRQKEKYGWEFLFLGANIDAVETAAHYGIGADRAATYVNDGRGVDLNYSSLDNAIRRMRRRRKEEMPIDASWKEEIEEDYKKRGK